MFTKKIVLFFFIIGLSIHLSAQDWEVLNDPPFLKHHSNGFGYNGKAYIMEGINTEDIFGSGGSKKVWEYTPSTDTWLQLEDFPGPTRAIAIGDDWNDKYYYGFGSSNDGYLNDLWEFNPEDLSFTQLPSCPCEGRSHPALIAHNDKIFMGAGTGFDDDLNDWWEYDMLTQEWSQKPDIPGGIRHHTFQFTIGDKIYVGGGHVANWLEYDPATEAWTNINDLPEGRVAGTQFDYNGMGYILAGDNTFHQHIPNAETFMRYNSQTLDWEYLEVLPNGSRWAPSSFIIDGILYYFGGTSYYDSEDNSMWKFDLFLLDNPPVSTKDDLKKASSIFAFPNPVQDKLNFGGTIQENRTYDITVLNSSGQTVLTVKDFNINEELNLASLTGGIYILELKNDVSSKKIKLIKGNKQ